MRILVLSPYLPHADAPHGGGVYLDALLSGLAELAADGTVTVGLVARTTLDEVAARIRPSPCASAWLVPDPERRDATRGSLGTRLRHQGRMLAGWLGGRPLGVVKASSTTLAHVVDDAARAFRPDLCLVEFAPFAHLATRLVATRPAGTTTPLVVFTDHEAGAPAPAALAGGTLGRGRDARLWERYVDRHFGSADLVQALNPDDAATLSQRLGRDVLVRPAVVRIPEQTVDPGAAPPRALFLGDWRHPPNPEAAARLVERVWPRVRAAHADAELWLAGPNATPEIEAYGSRDGVRWLGFVDDLAATLAAVRCLAAPVLSGHGSRIKVLTALAHGLPVVGNALGLRGVTAPAIAAARAEDDAGLAAALAAWLDDAGRARSAGRAGRAWAEANVSPRAVAMQQVERCATTLGREPAGG